VKLRLDSIRRDEVGWMATFYGKPDIHGNSFTIPISKEAADWLKVGKQYFFTIEEDE
jgi:hypothetical protein